MLNALLAQAHRHGVEIHHPSRVVAIARNENGFTVTAEGSIHASRVIIATGGKSIPKSGSDGFGYQLVKALGHSITPVVTPGLVPLTLPRGHFLCALAGVTLDATIELRSATGKRRVAFTNSTLLTHFGLSGRRCSISVAITCKRLRRAKAWRSSRIGCRVSTRTGWTASQSLKAKSVGGLARTIGRATRARTVRTCRRRPRDAEMRCAANSAGRWPRPFAVRTPVIGSRGYTFAEVTSGGVPLSNCTSIRWSRACAPGSICAERSATSTDASAGSTSSGRGRAGSWPGRRPFRSRPNYSATPFFSARLRSALALIKTSIRRRANSGLAT